METTNNNFGRIALSLSGGGYRAAAFHLGTLAMLDRLGLLGNVRALSTVSGGTITGAAYAAALTEKISFADFKRGLHRFLRDRNVITAALENLGKSVEINGAERMPSLIRAAADIYAADDLLGGKTFDFLISDDGSPLEEIAFNTTEFRTGISFRFQKSRSSSVTSGNNFAKIGANVNRKIRLADIVAASSCFPSGFEPIRFPSDFVWSGATNLPEIKRLLGEKFTKDIPLMDGGVFDNQGIDSLTNIGSRQNARFDVYIISDTSPRDDEILGFPPKPKSGRISLRFLYAAVWLLLICSIITTLSIISAIIGAFRVGRVDPAEIFFLYLIPLVMSVTVIVLIVVLRRQAVKMQKSLARETGIELWKYLKKLTLPEVIELIAARLKSVYKLTSSVFMKRIRALEFTQIFADPKLHDKLLPNLIYDLDNEQEWSGEIVSRQLQPSEKLRKMSREAESYSTNLWFLHSSKLDNLIECGGASICFKILTFLLKNKAVETSADSPEAELLSRVETVWRELNKS